MSEGFYDDEEYRKLREKKLQEYMKRIEQEQKLRLALSDILTDKALERLDNASLAYPDIAREAKALIIELVRAGKLKPPVDEATVARILRQLYEYRRGRGGRIEFKRKRGIRYG